LTWAVPVRSRLMSPPRQHDQKLALYAERQDNNTKEIGALKAALRAYMDRPPSPPSVVPPDLILREVEEPLLRAVRQDLRALLLEMREHILDALVNRNAEVYRSVWSKLALTLEMVEALAKEIETEEGQRVHVP
jgi:hypothetical protein